MQHLQPNTTISYTQPHISYNERENVWDIVEKEVSLQKITIINRRGYEEGYSELVVLAGKYHTTYNIVNYVIFIGLFLVLSDLECSTGKNDKCFKAKMVKLAFT